MFENYLDKNDRIIYSYRANKAGNILFIIASLQLALTVTIPIGSSSNPTEIYLRNISSIVSFYALGLFLNKWAYIIKKSKHSSKTMKHFKVLSLAMAIICVAKLVINIYFAVKYLPTGNMIGIYYLGEAIAWIALAVFFCAYAKKLLEIDTFRPKE